MVSLKLVSWLVLLKIVRKLNFLYGSIFGDIRLRDIGMIELFIVIKRLLGMIFVFRIIFNWL